VEELPVIMAWKTTIWFRPWLRQLLLMAVLNRYRRIGRRGGDLAKGRLDQIRALVTDINLRGSMEGWEVASRPERSTGVSHRLYDSLSAEDMVRRAFPTASF